MANLSYYSLEDNLLEYSELPSGIYYAVYDSCVTNHVYSFDLAFIEERSGSIVQDPTSGETYFKTLREAKMYVRQYFKSGEYFSIRQAENPDDFLQIIIDKVTYLVV